jgi:murein L,D-transpeptidase YafK
MRQGRMGAVTVTKTNRKCNAGAAIAHSAGAAPGLVLAAGLLVTAGAVFASDSEASTSRFALEISRSRNELLIKDGEQVIRRYHASFGRGGQGAKRRQGDEITPLGNYRIVEFKPDSRFHYFMLLNYPNLVDGWHGYRTQTIDAAEFKAIAAAYKDGATPPQNTALGGFIGIHGIGEVTPKKLKVHRSQNWTRGCIALRNEEITELREYVTRGTRVFISE